MSSAAVLRASSLSLTGVRNLSPEISRHVRLRERRSGSMGGAVQVGGIVHLLRPTPPICVV
jgi:hypothetical protein